MWTIMLIYFILLFASLNFSPRIIYLNISTESLWDQHANYFVLVRCMLQCQMRGTNSM